MPKQTGKGSRKRREAALTRNATQHHDFIGEAEPERAEAEFRKHERVEEERNADAVKEMAAELAEVAGVDKPETPLRIPRSFDEGKQLLRDAPQLLRDAPQKLREAPEMLREKARERLEALPQPARSAIATAEDVAAFLLAPVRVGLALARELIRIPGAMFRVIRHREA